MSKGQKVYMMGVCGTAMASLAGLLKSQGYDVLGSDKNIYPPMSTQLKNLNIPVLPGYDADNVDPESDLVIVGNVISRDNPEAQRLEELGLPFMSLPKAMSQFLIRDRNSVVIAGTHGKTTTTSLASWCADQAGLQPGFLVGGIPKNYGQSFAAGEGDWFVIEGDEYDTAYFDKVPKFIHYQPKYVILTSIEFDHADIYRDLDHVKDSFRQLLELIPEDGWLVYNGDDENIVDLLSYCRGNKISYGTGAVDVKVDAVKPLREGLEFTNSTNESAKKYFLPMFGNYNAFNATAVAILAEKLGWDLDLQEAFDSFQGIKRRQEVIGVVDDVQVIEDFAHHPTAVAMTIETFKARPKSGKLHAVFEPRSATSRRNIFHEQYVQAFAKSDFVYIAKPFNQDSIAEEKRFSSEKLVADIASISTCNAEQFESTDAIVAALEKNCQPGDTIVIMSNGGFDKIYDKVLSTRFGS